MDFSLEELTHDNFELAGRIDRSDIPIEFLDPISNLMTLTDYAVAHGCLGHTFLVMAEDRAIGAILIGELIPWETDPPEVRLRPHYRLMGFVLDRACRGRGLGGAVLEAAIDRVYRDFGPRPIVLSCQEHNWKAAAFYERHGFRKTEYMDDDDYYYLRPLPEALCAPAEPDGAERKEEGPC